MFRGCVIVVALVACDDNALRVVPSVVHVEEQGPLRIEGLAPDQFLSVAGDRAALVGDYRVDIGTTSTTVIAAEASGVTVVTDAPLVVGTYSLTVRANARSWSVADALSVVGDANDASAPSDGDPPRVCPSPPSGCTAFRCASTTSCYYVCEDRTYNGATQHCSSSSIGCLVTIGDTAENDCIAAATTPVFPDLVWIGYVQAAAAPEPAGGWKWMCDTSSFVAPNWGTFEPNDESGEDCGAMGVGGSWIDGDCGTSLRFVCELP